MPWRPGLDPGAGQEDRAGGAVVGAGRAVLGHAATELAEGLDQDAIGQPRGRQVVQKRWECNQLGLGSPTPGTIASLPDSSSFPASPIAGCRPTPSSTRIIRNSGSQSFLRLRAEPSSPIGTTVRMPSLPPSSGITNRIRPSRSGSAARAVRTRKLGSQGDQRRTAQTLSENAARGHERDLRKKMEQVQEHCITGEASRWPIARRAGASLPRSSRGKNPELPSWPCRDPKNSRSNVEGKSNSKPPSDLGTSHHLRAGRGRIHHRSIDIDHRTGEGLAVGVEDASSDRDDGGRWGGSAC